MSIVVTPFLIRVEEEQQQEQKEQKPPMTALSEALAATVALLIDASAAIVRSVANSMVEFLNSIYPLLSAYSSIDIIFRLLCVRDTPFEVICEVAEMWARFARMSVERALA